MFYFIAVFIIPQRWVFAIMGFLAVGNAYTMRVCLNLAITVMAPKDPKAKIDVSIKNLFIIKIFRKFFKEQLKLYILKSASRPQPSFFERV